MKISCAAARHCRVLVWFLGVALAPLFGQTDDHGTTATTATLVNANTTGAIDTTASLRNGLDAEIASGDDRGTYPNCRATVALTSGNGDVAPSRTRAVELDFQSQRRASKGGR